MARTRLGGYGLPPTPPKQKRKSTKRSALDLPIAANVGPSENTLRISNRFPRYHSGHRVAIIGDAPNQGDVDARVAFGGASGRLLDGLLTKAGLRRDAVYVGNVCQIQPPKNYINLFRWDGPEITEGIDQLTKDIQEFDPNVCVLLSSGALRAATGMKAVGKWRGSVIEGTQAPFIGRKCIPSWHPSTCNADYALRSILLFDLMKVARECRTKEITRIDRQTDVEITWPRQVQLLEELQATRGLVKVALDIEGGVNHMSCVSFASSPTSSFIVSFPANYEVWRAVSNLLEDPRVPKVLQNSLYDRFVLQYAYRICVRGVVDDTMLKHWEKYCELEKGLGFLCSIYTDIPYYKEERTTSDTHEDFWRYCCKDSMATHEINTALDSRLTTQQKHHYKFNMAMLNPLLYIELRGIKYLESKAAARRQVVLEDVYALQADLDEATGFGTKRDLAKPELLRQAQSLMCYKRDPNQPKKAHIKDYAKILAWLTNNKPITKHQWGHYNIVTGLGLNIRSTPIFKKYLYETKAYPVQRKKDPKTKEMVVTSDCGALLRLKQITNGADDVSIALDLGELRTRASMLAIGADPDGRVRCGYNVVGTDTGRLTCYTSPTGSGYNLQTIPDDNPLKAKSDPLRQGMRDLFVADDDHWLFQCDLSGADGWTVGAHLAALGDSTMLDDYRYGIKPAKVLCYMLLHGVDATYGKSRAEIKELIKSVQKDSWQYFASKIGQHMTSYLGSASTLAKQIFVQSAGDVDLSDRECGDLQKLFKIRYAVKLWHNWAQTQLNMKPVMTAASGHVRRFYDRPKQILGKALANEPQQNTTYATNLAVLKLWRDPENRYPEGEGRWSETRPFTNRDRLIIEPLHQVHDALVGQFPKERTPWATAKIKSWFANPITIAGITLTIPYEGSYGDSWGNMTEGEI